jgi:retinol dehydrogenase-12
MSSMLITFQGNVGLGKETIMQLSKHQPAHIYLSARSADKANTAIEEIKAAYPPKSSKPCPPITFIPCDLTSLPSVQAAARTFVSRESRLDILILNAGVMATPPGLTEQGYEIQFGTNHVGHAFLTKLLLPTLLKTTQDPAADVRVVSLASIGHIGAPLKGIDFNTLKTNMDGLTTHTFVRYGQSKLANILFTKELNKRYEDRGIMAVAVHPGVVNTELYRSTVAWPVVGTLVGAVKSALWTSVADGVKGQLWAATAPRGLVKSGEYYTPVGVLGQGSAKSSDMALAEKLWEWTEKELAEYTL